MFYSPYRFHSACWIIPGSEAMFADLGHFSQLSIQVLFFFILESIPSTNLTQILDSLGMTACWFCDDIFCPSLCNMYTFHVYCLTNVGTTFCKLVAHLRTWILGVLRADWCYLVFVASSSLSAISIKHGIFFHSLFVMGELILHN